MKINFIIPLLDDYDIELAYKNIDKACKESKIDYDIVFGLNYKLGNLFTKIRNEFVENNKIRAFMTDRPVNQHKLITLAMETSEKYDAVIVYSGKEETNVDVIKAFISSWQTGNKIVYLKKIHRGFAKVVNFVKTAFYKLGIAMLGIFRDVCAENDIHLLDGDVVKTINQLPNKNQLLRTLDSLIYYETDIIHLEVDPNEYINSKYQEKSKDYYNNLIISVVSLGISLTTLLLSGLFMLLSVNAHFLVHLLLWSVFILSGFIHIVFNTKRVLSVRVGTEVEIAELKSLKAKTEFYNF